MILKTIIFSYLSRQYINLFFAILLTLRTFIFFYIIFLILWRRDLFN